MLSFYCTMFGIFISFLLVIAYALSPKIPAMLEEIQNGKIGKYNDDEQVTIKNFYEISQIIQNIQNSRNIIFKNFSRCKYSCFIVILFSLIGIMNELIPEHVQIFTPYKNIISLVAQWGIIIFSILFLVFIVPIINMFIIHYTSDRIGTQGK